MPARSGGHWRSRLSTNSQACSLIALRCLCRNRRDRAEIRLVGRLPAERLMGTPSVIPVKELGGVPIGEHITVCCQKHQTSARMKLMGWTAPAEWHRVPDVVVGWMTPARDEPSATQVTTVGLDLAKRVFQVHGVDAGGRVVMRRTSARAGCSLLRGSSVVPGGHGGMRNSASPGLA